MKADEFVSRLSKVEELVNDKIKKLEEDVKVANAALESELDLRNEQIAGLQSELKDYNTLKSIVSRWIQGQGQGIEHVEDHTIRANIDELIAGTYTPTHAKNILKVFKASPKGICYPRAALTIKAGYTTSNSRFITDGLSWLKTNKYITEGPNGVKLFGE